MKKKNGFTLIEILSVIIIIGIIMIIAVPAVTKYIIKSNKSVYASNASAYLESVRAKYEMKEYGSLLKDDEIMVVPIGSVVFEKGNNTSSPYGDYDFNRSYVVIVPERNSFIYYATVIDSENVGLVKVKESEINEESIEEGITAKLPELDIYKNPGTIFDLDGRAYKRSDVRSIEGEDVNTDYDVYIFKDTGVIGKIKVMQLFSFGTSIGIVESLEHYYNAWHLDGIEVTSVEIPLKTGYTFEGYYTKVGGEGTKTINSNGTIVTDIAEQLGDYTAVFADFSVNPLIFNGGNKSITFSYNNQQITIAGATNGTGHYTYTEVEEKDSSGNPTNYISLNGTTIKVNGNTPAGTYTYVVHVKDDVSGAEEDATFILKINKAQSNITCTNRTYNGSAQNMYVSYDGCTPSTNSSVTNATTTSFTVLCKGDTNHNDSTCNAIMDPQKCNAPSNVSISPNGEVTWTPSSNCSSGQHQISINKSSWTDASSGVNYKSTITASKGTRTVYVNVEAPNENYFSDNDSIASGSTTVYSVSLTAGTGIQSVSGAGNYIAGSTVTINATLKSDYNWSKWTGTPSTTTKNYSATISSDWNATAKGESKSHTYGMLCTCVGEKYCQMAEVESDSTSNLCNDADGWCNRACIGWMRTAGCNPPSRGYSRGCRVIK